MEPSTRIKKAERVVKFAADNDIELTLAEAEQYLEARKRLKGQPNDPEAQRVSRHYAALFYLCGSPKGDFTPFIEGLRCPHDCPECGMRNDADSDRQIARWKQIEANLGKETVSQ